MKAEITFSYDPASPNDPNAFKAVGVFDGRYFVALGESWEAAEQRLIGKLTTYKQAIENTPEPKEVEI